MLNSMLRQIKNKKIDGFNLKNEHRNARID